MSDGAVSRTSGVSEESEVAASGTRNSVGGGTLADSSGVKMDRHFVEEGVVITEINLVTLKKKDGENLHRTLRATRQHRV